MRDRGVFLARVARIDAGAAGEVHVRGEADGDVGCDSFHHPGPMCHEDVVVHHTHPLLSTSVGGCPGAVVVSNSTYIHTYIHAAE